MGKSIIAVLVLSTFFLWGCTRHTSAPAASSAMGPKLTLNPQLTGPTYYVATTGSDQNNGSQSAPFRTISYAYSKAVPGTTILVAPGRYTDYQSNWGLHLGLSGTATNPILLQSQVRGAAIIDGQNLPDRHEGINIDGNYNIVDGFVITGGPLGGVSVWGNGNQILRNEIHHNGNNTTYTTKPDDGQDGLYSSEGTSNNVYEQNYIHDNGRTTDTVNFKYDHGLYLCGNNELVINNISVHNAGNGLQIAGYKTVTNMKVYNNVFSYNGTSGVVYWQAMNGVDIRNNIIVGNQRYGIYDCGATGGGVLIDHNVIHGNNASQIGYTDVAVTDQCNDTPLKYDYSLLSTLSVDPMFSNQTGNFSQASDFTLQPGSPAIDAGLDLSTNAAADAIDIMGTARPQGNAYDIGAYEYAPPTTPGCVTSSDTWMSIPIPTHSGDYRVEFDATPSVNDVNGVMGLSQAIASDYTDLAAILRFNPTGSIDARNAGNYSALASIPYTAGSSYHFTMDVHANETYDAYVKPAGGSQLTVGTGLAFRSEQASTASAGLGFLSMSAAAGSQTVCNLAVGPIPPAIPVNNSCVLPCTNGAGAGFNLDTLGISSAADCLNTCTAYLAFPGNVMAHYTCTCKWDGQDLHTF